VLKGWMTSQNI